MLGHDPIASEPLASTSISTTENVFEVKYYNGSAWLSKPLKIYNGTSWVTVLPEQAKKWNGTNWIVI